MPSIPFFDSKECQWADMDVMLGGSLVTKIRGIKYKAKKAKTLLHAGGDEPISVQAGNREYEGSIKVLKGAADDMNRAAISAGGTDMLDVAFDIVITYQPQGTRALQQDTCVGVEVTEFEKGWEQGADHMDIDLPIVFLRLLTA